MTATPLDRVAKALCKTDGNDPDADWSEWKPNMPNPPYEPAWRSYLDGARAVVEALREPSERSMTQDVDRPSDRPAKGTAAGVTRLQSVPLAPPFRLPQKAREEIILELDLWDRRFDSAETILDQILDILEENIEMASKD